MCVTLCVCEQARPSPAARRKRCWDDDYCVCSLDWCCVYAVRSDSLSLSLYSPAQNIINLSTSKHSLGVRSLLFETQGNPLESQPEIKDLQCRLGRFIYQESRFFICTSASARIIIWQMREKKDLPKLVLGPLGKFYLLWTRVKWSVARKKSN